jgi:hypothetical protein
MCGHIYDTVVPTQSRWICPEERVYATVKSAELIELIIKWFLTALSFVAGGEVRNSRRVVGTELKDDEVRPVSEPFQRQRLQFVIRRPTRHRQYS